MFSSRELRKIARDKLRGNWGIAILTTFVAGLLGGTGGSSGVITYRLNSSDFSSGVGGGNGFSGLQDFGQELENALSRLLSNPLVTYIGLWVAFIALIIGLALLVVGACVELGHVQFYIDLCNNRVDGVGVLFSKFNYFLKAVGLRLYIGLLIFLWSLLLLIPGIIAGYFALASLMVRSFNLFFALLCIVFLTLCTIPAIIAGYRYAMAPYLMAQDPGKGIRECVNESKALMQGHKWRLFCLHLSFFGWSLLSVLSLGIGFLWLFPYMHAADAAFYLERSGQGIPLTPQPEPGV